MAKLTPSQRRKKSEFIRNQAADVALGRPHVAQTPNGDEQKFAVPNRTGLGNYSKGLPHIAVDDPLAPGQVEPDKYRQFVRSLDAGDSDDFRDIPCNSGAQFRKLVNPQAGQAFDLEGPDAQAVALPPPPGISSLEAGAEMAELYWMVLLRDVQLDAFNTNPLATDAANDLSGYEFFQSIEPNQQVTTATLFRATAAGARNGGYVSQFLLIGNNEYNSNGLTNPPTALDGLLKYGAFYLSQKLKSAADGKDYMKTEPCWLDIQNGKKASASDIFLPERRFITTPRDLATYVHFDALYEAYLNACWYLLNENDPGNKKTQLYKFGPGNPYNDSDNQEGFGTYGGPHILSLVTEVATRALKCVWFQKWQVHRRLRPEAFAGRVHFHLKSGRKLYGQQGLDEVINPTLLDDLSTGKLGSHYGPGAGKTGSYFLPQAFPEGSPMHPSYGAGHATVAGACVTVLKAFFDETAVFLKPVRVKLASNGQSLGQTLEFVPNPTAQPLTVGGELNKLAANVSVGRNMAGVHYWSDDFHSRNLGEQIAIGILQEQSLTYNEKRASGGETYFTFTRFDGRTKVTIADGEVFEAPVA